MKNDDVLKKNIRDKENQISVYQKSAIQNYEIAEITRKELDHTQRENEEQKQLISKQQESIENFLSQKELEKKKTMTLVINTQPILRTSSSWTIQMNKTTTMKKTILEIEEEENKTLNNKKQEMVISQEENKTQ